MIKKKDNILFVANLQVFATPYASLYLDEERDVLCLFVRMSNPLSKDTQYAMADVTSSMVSQYLNKQVGLDALLFSEGYKCAQIRNNEVYMENGTCFTPDETFERAKYFNPKYCEDSTRLKFFLKRYNKRLNN